MSRVYRDPTQFRAVNRSKKPTPLKTRGLLPREERGPGKKRTHRKQKWIVVLESTSYFAMDSKKERRAATLFCKKNLSPYWVYLGEEFNCYSESRYHNAFSFRHYEDAIIFLLAHNGKLEYRERHPRSRLILEELDAIYRLRDHYERNH